MCLHRPLIFHVVGLLPLSHSLYIYIYMSLCVSTPSTHISCSRTPTTLSLSVYIYIYICLCVCLHRPLTFHVVGLHALTREGDLVVSEVLQLAVFHLHCQDRLASGCVFVHLQGCVQVCNLWSHVVF